MLCLLGALLGSTSCLLVPFIESDYVPPDDNGIGTGGRGGYSGPHYVRRKSSSAQGRLRRLIADLKNSDDVVRTHAATDLGMMGGNATEAVDPLVFALERDESKWVRRAAAKALGKIGTTRGAAALQKATRDKDHWVAHSAKNALARLSKS